ncbi:MAG TPA: hypothetical protein VEY92_05830 [Pseudoxanthomonas sp.]|nr:hypothetical protein [Pseudoxanthomonas sp.]
MRAILAAFLLSATAPALAENIPLPPNVTLKPGNKSGDYIDMVSQEVRGGAFPKLKLCLAQLVSNQAVILSGSAQNPFSPRLTGESNTTTVQGGQLFKYEDTQTGTVIAVGSTDGGQSMMGMTRSVVRFELMAAITPERTTLRFSNIDRADLNTYGAANSGFTPVGAWRGAKPLAVIETLQALGGRLDSCLQ